MRDVFARRMVDQALSDARFMVLTGDHGYALFDPLRQSCPRAYLNVGVAEQNMVGVAAGLAKGGYRPLVYGLAAFVPMRVLEQIKLDVCHSNLPVVFVGDGAGVVYGTLGVSHQCAEDVAALRALPNLRILSPADADEMEACLDLAFRWEGPVYVRMGKADRPAVHDRPCRFEWGQLLTVQMGVSPLGWIATGSMVSQALDAAKAFPGSSVHSAPCLKPIDRQRLAAISVRHSFLVTLEEHHACGGLGSIVAELSAESARCQVLRLGIDDRFSATVGSHAHLLAAHGLDVASIVRRVEQWLTAHGASTRRRAA